MQYVLQNSTGAPQLLFQNQFLEIISYFVIFELLSNLKIS